ncbi:hypothetical protein BU25DRAFT_386304 [Macroventuria anomochaeta]|uniref:Uncharacterized protein n=1 Tax=Macroventuria anomochaeta TaxID=301207 RepID=A0ACB6SDD9_9PLEO|nr:uncharacterized protein BU25DRAFT_386304 [Macroventuria anomochaeta]KAF2631269.1 hypothetical protein BU25DRAFT_386304 [Macroventuria anomochaeta]
MTATLTIPMGFGAQIKALQEGQRDQAERIAALERENAKLRASKEQPPDLLARIEALEQHNAHLTARRKEAVAQLLNLRTLHQEASNAFLVRASDIESDDLEGMLGVYGTSMTTVINQHQRALGQMRMNGQILAYATGVPQGVGCYPVNYAYPPNYNQSGYCHAHQLPYPCRVCGQ